MSGISELAVPVERPATQQRRFLRAVLGNRKAAVGQQRLLDLAERGEVLDTCLYTTPGKYGGGGAATTWLVGSAGDVAAALKGYRKLGITHFVLSDTPYKREIARVGDQLLPLLRETGAQQGR